MSSGDLNEVHVPCSPIMTRRISRTIRTIARAICISNGKTSSWAVKGIGVVPKFSQTPGKIGRGAPGIGHDNQRIYGDLLGLTATELEALKRDKII